MTTYIKKLWDGGAAAGAGAGVEAGTQTVPAPGRGDAYMNGQRFINPSAPSAVPVPSAEAVDKSTGGRRMSFGERLMVRQTYLLRGQQPRSGCRWRPTPLRRPPRNRESCHPIFFPLFFVENILEENNHVLSMYGSTGLCVMRSQSNHHGRRRSARVSCVGVCVSGCACACMCVSGRHLG